MGRENYDAIGQYPTISDLPLTDYCEVILADSPQIYGEVKQILSKNNWYDLMTPEDFRAITPLIYNHVNPYGDFNLDMEERIPIEISTLNL